jgi:hypothetical protein
MMSFASGGLHYGTFHAPASVKSFLQGLGEPFQQKGSSNLTALKAYLALQEVPPRFWFESP